MDTTHTSITFKPKGLQWLTSCNNSKKKKKRKKRFPGRMWLSNKAYMHRSTMAPRMSLHAGKRKTILSSWGECNRSKRWSRTIKAEVKNDHWIRLKGHTWSPESGACCGWRPSGPCQDIPDQRRTLNVGKETERKAGFSPLFLGHAVFRWR